MEALAKIFTGKSGTLRMIVVGLVALGIADLVIENNYQFNGTRDNDSISLRPAKSSVANTVAQNQSRRIQLGVAE